MITNETQLVIVDEWSTTRMDSDLAKCILQGGWMVTAVKHGVPQTVLNNSPYYITANEVPDFGDDDENVPRRIQIFNTKSLPYTERGIDKWLHDNAMDCIVWIADQINKYRRFIPKEELWYETNNDRELTICANKGESLFDHAQLKRITRAVLSSHAMDHDDTTMPVIHESFAEEVRARRLRRKRRMRRLPESSDEETESLDIWGKTNSHFLVSFNKVWIFHQSTCYRFEYCVLMIVNKYYFVLSGVNESLDEDERDNESRHDDDDEGDSKTPEDKGDSKTPEDEDDDESPEDADDHGSADDDEKGRDDNSPDDDQNAGDNNSSDQDLNTGDNQSPDNDDNNDDAPGDDSHGYDDGEQQQRGVDSEHNDDQMSQAQGGESEQPAHVADEGTVLSSMTMVRYSPSSAYVLNDIYLAKVAAILKYTLEHSATKAHVHGFLEQLRQTKQGKTKIQKDFWTTPDPSIDAWMLLTGRQREAFDLAAIVRKNPTILPHVESLRKKANVLVLASRCPIAKEMERQKREGEGESSQLQPEVPSQSYWTVVKKLLPW